MHDGQVASASRETTDKRPMTIYKKEPPQGMLFLEQGRWGLKDVEPQRKEGKLWDHSQPIQDMEDSIQQEPLRWHPRGRDQMPGYHRQE